MAQLDEDRDLVVIQASADDLPRLVEPHDLTEWCGYPASGARHRPECPVVGSGTGEMRNQAAGGFDVADIGDCGIGERGHPVGPEVVHEFLWTLERHPACLISVLSISGKILDEGCPVTTIERLMRGPVLVDIAHGCR